MLSIGATRRSEKRLIKGWRRMTERVISRSLLGWRLFVNISHIDLLCVSRKESRLSE